VGFVGGFWVVFGLGGGGGGGVVKGSRRTRACTDVAAGGLKGESAIAGWTGRMSIRTGERLPSNRGNNFFGPPKKKGGRTTGRQSGGKEKLQPEPHF